MLSLDAFSRAQSVTNAFGGRALPGPAGGSFKWQTVNNRMLLRDMKFFVYHTHYIFTTTTTMSFCQKNSVP